MKDRALFTALAGLLAACSGNIAGEGSKAPDPTGPGMTPGPGSAGGGGAVAPVPAPAGVTASVAPLRRLTVDQYRNTIADLLGAADAVDPAALPADESIDDRFISNTVRPVQGSDVERYAVMAEAIARKAVSNLGGLLGCDPAGA